MVPWYKATTPRREVRQGRSFNPDEFAIHLEQVVAKAAPADYRDPKQFFARNCFTRALRSHAGMVLRRLSGQTANAAPVLTLVTQFGGGKTHTLAALYHLATSGAKAKEYSGVPELLRAEGLSAVPEARVAVFVGNAWDPQEGRETPWIDVARQLAGDKGVAELGPSAKTVPPGTEALARVFKAAGGPVLLLFDEVLNLLNRHRGLADPFHAFIQNLTVAATGLTHGAAVISLPRSQVEMTEWDMQWQDRISKVVRRVAKDLIANDEAEIGEVVRRRLFEDLGSDRVRRNVAKAFADWCFERRAQLPPEWTSVDSAATEAKARERLRERFETCYPFHPGALSVFQRKWQALPQYQQTRGTLAMLAQWISLAAKDGFKEARREPLITIGSAPLRLPEFRSVVLGQLGEARLVAAIDADISGEHSHARALDADTKGALRGIHERVGTAILFESSGGQVDKTAHLPELRFALGEPEVDTTSVDNAAYALESKSYFLRRVGSDGFKISHQPTLKKVVSDRRASLDEETEIRPAMEKVVREEFKEGASVPVVDFPEDGAAVQDTPRLRLVLADPGAEWTGGGDLRRRIAEWTWKRGKSDRHYPGALVWCVKKEGRDLRDKVELWLAWRRVDREAREGVLGGEFDRAELAEIKSKAAEAEDAANEEVWASYRYAVLADSQEPDGLKAIDLGAGHSSGHETLCGRVVGALKSESLLSETVGSGHIERNWPPAFKESGAWPLTSLRQSFLNGSLTRLLDPDATLRTKIAEFVAKSEFGLASGQKPDGDYERVFFDEAVDPSEVVFEPGVFLLKKEKAEALKSPPSGAAADDTDPEQPIEQAQEPASSPDLGSGGETEPAPPGTKTGLRVVGEVPPEMWNRLGTALLPKLRGDTDLKASVEFSVSVEAGFAKVLEQDLLRILNELGLAALLRVERR